MSPDLFNTVFDKITQLREKQVRAADQASRRAMQVNTIKKVKGKGLAYSERHRGTWHRPEYDFDEIQIAQDTDSYLGRSIQKKVNKLLCAGFEFTGNDTETVAYIQRRWREFEFATNKPGDVLMGQISADMFRFNNCMLVKVRNFEASSGERRRDLSGTLLEPVAGYFILPFETLQFKSKANGELKKIMQKMPDGEKREFFPRDIVHFYSNRKPGFTVGTPELFAALDDIALLRRIEENVEELLETNLFPVFHYKVGTDTLPERVGPDGLKESEVVRNTIEYMPAGGIYVSDHRHEIQAIGSEGRALRIDFYLTYFKNRVLAAIGSSTVDMGEGGGTNRSTAATMSKGMLMDVEAVACLIKAFFDFYIINELMLEGGYDPLDPDQKVEIKFGVIDKEEKRADENHMIQAFHGNVRDLDETRKALGEAPWRDEQIDRTYFKMFEEPLALVKGIGPGSAAGDVLAGLPGSNVTPEAVSKERAFAEKMQKQSAKAGASGAKPNSSGTGSRRSAASRNRPSNQSGTRSTAKTNKDLTTKQSNITIYADSGNLSCTKQVDFEVDEERYAEWYKLLLKRYDMLSSTGVSFEAVIDSMLWRLKIPELNDD